MSAARATAGSLLALFVVGAVVHYRSARHASSDFVSASALDIDSLPACAAPTEGATTVAAATVLSGIATKAAGPCACGKSVCTPGRICLKDPDGEGNDQCYLPRCNDGAAVDATYIAGCVCGPNAVFKSGKPTTAVLGDETVSQPTGLPACTDTKVTTTRCTCGTMVCEEGVICDAQTNAKECGGKAGVTATTVKSQTHALIVPGNLTDPTTFAICKNTNSGGLVQCFKDATDGEFCKTPTR